MTAAAAAAASKKSAWTLDHQFQLWMLILSRLEWTEEDKEEEEEGKQNDDEKGTTTLKMLIPLAQVRGASKYRATPIFQHLPTLIPLNTSNSLQPLLP